MAGVDDLGLANGGKVGIGPGGLVDAGAEQCGKSTIRDAVATTHESNGTCCNLTLSSKVRMSS